MSLCIWRSISFESRLVYFDDSEYTDIHRSGLALLQSSFRSGFDRSGMIILTARSSWLSTLLPWALCNCTGEQYSAIVK